MSKSFKIFGIILLIFVLFAGLTNLGSSEKTDWRKSYDVKSKKPFGLYIFNQEANALLHGKLKRTADLPEDFFNENADKPRNILVVQSDIDMDSWNYILQEVKKGSDMMLIATDCNKSIQHSLKILISVVNYGDRNILKLTDKKFVNDSLVLDKFPEDKGFYYLSENHEILGKSDYAQDELQSNFIKINYGKGHVYFHSDPTILTNYYLLKPGTEKYVQNVFSYLPDRETVWFTNSYDDGNDQPSALSFILSKPALKYAWWILLAGLFLFALFNAKRKQRIIPIKEPLQNKSVEFVKSIGNLYLQEGDFHDMMAKKAQYFLNKVRMDLLIDTQNLNDDFAQKLHLKTGKDLETIQEAIKLIKNAQNPYASVMKEDLIKMNSLLDDILK